MAMLAHLPFSSHEVIKRKGKAQAAIQVHAAKEETERFARCSLFRGAPPPHTLQQATIKECGLPGLWLGQRCRP